MRLKNITGQRFERLVVIKRGENTSNGTARWICECDCGSESLLIRGTELRAGNSKSCGCLNMEILSRTNKGNKYGLKHRMCGTPEYNSWNGILMRCNNQNHKSFKDYGNRGITVCDRWKNSFENFYEDMGSRPGAEYSIDRIDNNGNYEPSNCRWATITEQNQNTRTNAIKSIAQAEEIRTKYKTGKYTQQELSKMYSCSYVNMNNIINNKRWI